MTCAGDRTFDELVDAGLRALAMGAASRRVVADVLAPAWVELHNARLARDAAAAELDHLYDAHADVAAIRARWRDTVSAGQALEDIGLLTAELLTARQRISDLEAELARLVSFLDRPAVHITSLGGATA